MSDNEMDSFMEEEDEEEVEEEEERLARGSIPGLGPVSPNPNYQISDYVPLFPSSSITSMDGGSQESYSDSELEVSSNRPPQPRYGMRNELQLAMAAADIARSLENMSSSLRTVPATTDLTTPRARPIHPMIRSPSPSSPYSASPSTSLSQLINHESGRASATARRLQMLNTILQRAMERRRLRNNRRRRSVHFEENDRETERVPPSAYAEVMRRGNSISDCSQCSSDEEDSIAGPIIPTHLVEWSYPGPTN